MSTDPRSHRPAADQSTERLAVEDTRRDALALVVFAGDEAVVHALPSGGQVAIGRATDNDVLINHPSVSRRHAVLHLDPPLRLQDLGGKNGTFLREVSISGQTVEIRVGDAVTLGDTLVVLRRPLGGGADRPACSPLDAGEIVVRDPAMRAIYDQVDLCARGLISVLLLGETGVGKEVVARAVHRRSPRAGRPFLGLNCAALSESLLESELFGHEKGAFTGATAARPGLFEAADGGTVFLDELGEMPMSLQVKLLRVIEQRQVLRVGGRAPRGVDVRFVSASNVDLEAAVARGAFRQDLFFRLNGIALTIPPLRERVSEIAPLAEAFIARACREAELPRTPAISSEVRSALTRYRWPGNIRELRNVVERAVTLGRGVYLLPEHLPAKLRVPAPEAEPAARSVAPPAMAVTARSPAERPLDAAAGERARIVHALEQCAGNQTKAADLLGISRRTLVSRLGAYGLPRPRQKRS